MKVVAIGRLIAEVGVVPVCSRAGMPIRLLSVLLTVLQESPVRLDFPGDLEISVLGSPVKCRLIRIRRCLT